MPYHIDGVIVDISYTLFARCRGPCGQANPENNNDVTCKTKKQRHLISPTIAN